MTEDELKKFKEEERLVRLIQSGRNALVRRSPIGSAATGLREAYSQAGKELTEASRQPSFAGRTGAGIRALARMPGRFLGTTAADMYGTAERVYGADADTLGRFGRALMTGSEAETPAAVTRTPAVNPPAPNMADTARSEARRVMAEEPAAVSTRNVITDAQGNRTFIDETGNVRTISASGQDITGQRRMPVNVQGREQDGDALYPQSAGVKRTGMKRTWVNAAPISPDYGFGQQRETPQRIADTVNPDQTFGDFVTTGRRQLRAATADQRADLERENIAQRIASENADRTLRAADIIQRGKSEAADYDLRRQQVGQQGAYQQGQLNLQQKELAAKTAEAGATRNLEADRQARLDAALNIYDNPNTAPEVKQRARRIIEANQGQASFDLGEKPMTQEAAQKSLQDTWRAVAGNNVPLDPASAEQLQGVAQANPAAWKAVYGKATPEMVQRYNVLSRLPDAEIAKDPMISALIKKSGGGGSPEEARRILEELIRKQRGF